MKKLLLLTAITLVLLTSCKKDECEQALVQANNLEADYKEGLKIISSEIYKLENEKKRYTSRIQNIQNSNYEVGSQLYYEKMDDLATYQTVERELTKAIESMKQSKEKYTKDYEFKHETIKSRCPNNLVTRKVYNQI